MSDMNVGRDFGQKFVQGMQDVGKQISKELKEIKADMRLPTKAEVKDKLSRENVKKGAQKLSEGVMKMAKKTAGATLVGLSMITPRSNAESLAPRGMKLLTGREVGQDYGSYKREKIGQQAKTIYGKALLHLGKGIEKAAHDIAFHSKVPSQSKLFDAATSVGQAGTQMKIEGEIVSKKGEEKLEAIKESRKEVSDEEAAQHLKAFLEEGKISKEEIANLRGTLDAIWEDEEVSDEEAAQQLKAFLEEGKETVSKDEIANLRGTLEAIWEEEEETPPPPPPGG